jgi:hypothetical protein
MREHGYGTYAKNSCACGNQKDLRVEKCRACYDRERAADHGTESRYTGGCRCDACRQAGSEAKRQRRIASRVPCSHGCGAMVDWINRRDPRKLPECRPCSNARINADRKVAA